jgi:hypothetical protein
MTTTLLDDAFAHHAWATALTALGIEPPDVAVWAFGAATGRVTEVEPTT